MPCETPHLVSGSDADTVRSELLSWYRTHRRDLPWRAGCPSARAGDRPDPYHVLVSEAMLQQTRVATVVDYFHRFLDAFPTLRDLADADEQRVLRLWQGLGYYRRARHLHAAARAIVDRHAGRVPDTVAALRELPGVGPYTAGAVASIAYDRPAPLLDGNVARVLTRLHGIDQPVDDSDTRRRLWELARRLADGPSPGDTNQALMELGATVCTPRDPACHDCPLRARCAAAARGRAHELPKRRPKRRPTAATHAVVAVRRRGELLFERRSDRGLWAGMWQLPTWEDDPDPSDLPRRVAERHGLKVESPTELDAFTHQTTHRTITFRLFLAPALGGRLRRAGPDRSWRTPHRLDDLPLPNPQRNALRILAERGP